MSMPALIKVFEHEHLEIDDENFKRHHWKSLAHFNTRNNNKYFTLYPDGIKFCQYVGVVQAGNLTIEILPKSDKESKDKNKWQKVLLKILKECRFIKVEHPEQAYLSLHSGSILDAYLSLFLNEIERLLHVGLIKKYHKVERNLQALKGKLLLQQHLSRNIVHQEKFYVQYSVYDKEHLIHQILLKTLKLISKISVNALICGKANRLLLQFPEMTDIDFVSEQTFKKIKFDRKTAVYRECLMISKMLLLNYRPALTSGVDHVLSMLFDMNKLWEEYVYRQLLKLSTSWEISRQNSIEFWQPFDQKAKHLRPDIIISNHPKGKLAIDTKWKLIEDEYPSDDDLKQMFAYAHYVESNHLILLYPSSAKKKHGGCYLKEHTFESFQKAKVNCSVFKIPLKWVDDEFVGLDLELNDFI
jgi:5-methylcytosine-specific restriction enzyme subunit McrC